MNSFIYYYTLAIASLLLFLYGFFPVQQNQAANSVEPPTSLHDFGFNVSHLYKPEINRMILVVIDALRLDFITERNMPFLSAAYPKEGCMLTVHVESPTVTLPRIKALTTGSIPQFVDVIFNLASTESLTDSFIHKAKEAGKKIIFYGDDTWLKLYPAMFSRSEGVSSFYVSDYTEVDLNVTRNVVQELDREDWDIMLLHYLGLDHIGHVFGPFSHLVQPKLREMDKVIEIIHQRSKKWNGRTLIAVTGDHGMKDSGGHGGSTTGETTVPLVSLGIPCITDHIAQTDVPATLSALMGLRLPSSSVGRVISNMLIVYPLDRLLYVLHYGALALRAKRVKHDKLFDEALSSHYSFLKTNNENAAVRAQKLYEECSKVISDELVHSSVKQDIFGLLVASGLLTNCFCAILYDFIKPCVISAGTKMLELTVMTAILVTQFVVGKSHILTTIFLFSISICVLRYIMLILRAVKWKLNCDSTKYLIISGTFMHLLSLLSSSFIEEEHQVWYFFWGTFVIISSYLVLPQVRTIPWLSLFLSLRLLRTINQTGDKWAHLPDFSQWLILDDSYYYLQVFFGTSLALTCFSCLSLYGKKKKGPLLLTAIIVILLYIFHTVGGRNSLLVQLTWLILLLNFTLGIIGGIQLMQLLIVTWMLFCALLMRPYNVILIPSCVFASMVTSRFIKDMSALTIVHIWLGRMFFFCQGHSNSLASIDIAAGYVGLQEYVPFLVILQVICHTYAFPILTSLLLFKNNFKYADAVWTVTIICRLSVLIVTCVLILIQRHHLFVWSVFAPKLLIESCHSAVLFVQVGLFYTIINVNRFFLKVFRNK